MLINIELSEKELTNLIIEFIANKLNHDIDSSALTIQVKSTQNYKSEWEKANFRAVYRETR